MTSKPHEPSAQPRHPAVSLTAELPEPPPPATESTPPPFFPLSTFSAAASACHDAEEKIARMLAASAVREEAFRAELAALPSARGCALHAGQVAVLVEDASFAAARAVYRCPLCVQDATALRKERRIRDSGIPADVRHATLANFETQRASIESGPGLASPAQFLEAARDFAARRVRNLLLCGPPGIGKGHLAAAVGMARLAEGHSVAWMQGQRLFREWHAAYSAEGPERLLAKLLRADLLVLDEAALRDLPADGEEILFSILDGRHKTALQTCLLSNATVAEVKRWLGGRLVDRLRSGKVTALYGQWSSMRGSAGDGAREGF